MLNTTTDFLFAYTLPAADDYMQAESALSNAYAGTSNLANCASAAHLAIRRACEVAVAIDALTDRAAAETGMSAAAARAAVAILSSREGALERVSGAANAYKHGSLTATRHPITSYGDILAVGTGYGVDGFGVGKMSGVEVILTLTNGTQRKFLGDVPLAIRAWLQFLDSQGATIPVASLIVCNVHVWP